MFTDYKIEEGDIVEVCQVGDDKCPAQFNGGYTITISDLLPPKFRRINMVN
jgi:hypothetical protein